MSNNDNVSRLNQHLQGRHQTQLLSWSETPKGPAHSPAWDVVCKIDGVVKGTGHGTSKTQAKNNAAGQALVALGVDKPESTAAEAK